MIDREDYEEPRCLLCMDNKESIPIARIIDKLDLYLSEKQYENAESLIKFWEREAEEKSDFRGELALLNEDIGLSRKTGKKENAFLAIEKALALLTHPDISGTVSVGTTYLNIATAYKAFEETDKAIEYYQKARGVYDKTVGENDLMRSGLYNNTALCYSEKGEYQKAEELFNKALEILSIAQNCETEIAITYTNIADLYYSQGRDIKQVTENLQKAKEFLDKVKTRRDGDYAYAVEKCADTFKFYGDEEYYKELTERAKNIYERS